MLGLPGFELPEAIHPAQEEFDNRLAAALDGMADRMDGMASTQVDDLTTAYTATRTSGMEGYRRNNNTSTPQMQSFLLLSRRIADLADCVERDI